MTESNKNETKTQKTHEPSHLEARLAYDVLCSFGAEKEVGLAAQKVLLRYFELETTEC
jgi:hypothetical protein